MKRLPKIVTLVSIIVFAASLTQNSYYIADENPIYAKIIGYGTGYWLWLTSGVLVIVSGAIGLMKERQAILISDH